jgi:predicted transcriptional regulator of viral defense system
VDRPHSDPLSSLPDTFRYTQALEHLNERQFRSLLADRRITPVARGLYRKSEWNGDEDLIEIAYKAPRATIALRSALARHDLIDDIPRRIDIAVPRGSWTPSLVVPVRWHHFAEATFDVGRTTLDTEAGDIGIYSPERSIIDAFRLRQYEGDEVAVEALKRWLRQGGHPSDLLVIAESFPRVVTPLRKLLSVIS